MSNSEPIRTCLGCRLKAPKRDLLRLVVGVEGQVVADPLGRLPGRGAYIHRAHGCWVSAQRRVRSSLRLRDPVDLDDVDDIVKLWASSR